MPEPESVLGFDFEFDKPPEGVVFDLEQVEREVTSFLSR